MRKITSFLLSLVIIFSVCDYSVFASSEIRDYDYNAAKPLIESHDVISFDIFDTLLVRPYAKPDDLFKHLKLLQDECGFTKEQPNGKGSELEKIILQPHTENVELFNYAKSLGKKIIIISDMYLHEDFLSEVLRKNGIDGWSKMYVSSDYKASKGSGKLFDIVLNDLQIEPNTILHIGDNKKSDCEMARSRGLDYFWTPKLLVRLFEKEPRLRKYYKENEDSLTVSIIIGLCSLNILQHNENYWYNLGYLYGGPICYAYVRWLKEELKKDGIKEALFVARDGYTPKKVFDLIKDEDCKINTHYAYVPRCQYSCCTLDYLNSENQLKYILDYYKDKDEFLKCNTPDLNDIEACKKFLNDNMEIYKRLAVLEKAEYENYISEFNLVGKKVGLIDGDSGKATAFKFLKMFIKEEDSFYYTMCGNKGEHWKRFCFKLYKNFIKIGQPIFKECRSKVVRIENNTPIHDDVHMLAYNPKREKQSQAMVDFAQSAEKSFKGYNLFFNTEDLYKFSLVLNVEDLKLFVKFKDGKID